MTAVQSAVTSIIPDRVETTASDIIVAPRNNSLSDSWVFAAGGPAEWAANTKRRLRFRAGVWNFDAVNDISAYSGLTAEWDSGSSIVSTITDNANPLTAIFLAKYTSSGTQGTITSSNTVGTATLAMSYKPTAGQYIRVRDNVTGSNWRIAVYKVISATGSSSPYTVTVDRPVQGQFGNGDLVFTLSVLPKNITLIGNGCAVSGTATRHGEFLTCWKLKVCGFQSDASGISDIAWSHDEGSFEPIFDGMTVRGGSAATIGLALESIEGGRIKNSYATGCTIAGHALYDGIASSIEDCDADQCAYGAALFSDNNTLGCLSSYISGGEFTKNTSAGVVVSYGSTDCRVIGVTASKNGDGIYVTDGATSTQVIGCSGKSNTTYGLRIGEKSSGWTALSGGNVTNTIVSGGRFVSNGTGGIGSLRYGKDTQIFGADVSNNGNGTSTGVGLTVAYEEAWASGLTGTAGNCSRACDVTNGGTLHLRSSHLVFNPASPDHALYMSSTNTLDISGCTLELGASCNGIYANGGTIIADANTVKPYNAAASTIAFLCDTGGTMRLGPSNDGSAAGTPISLGTTSSPVLESPHIYAIKEATDAAAGTATSETIVWTNTLGRAVYAYRLRFLPSAGLTADDTNYATMKVWKRDASGSTQTALAAVTTKTSGSGGSGTWTAFVPITLATVGASTLTNPSIAAGWSVSIEITKTAGGVAVPRGMWILDYL